MSAERYLVQVSRNGKKRTRVWEANRPIPVGEGMSWVLEPCAGTQTVRLRYLGGGAQQIEVDASLLISREESTQGRKIALPESDTAIELRRLKRIQPAYAAPKGPSETKDSPQLTLAYEGVGKTVIGYQRMHAAYVAYSRGKPVFTVVTTAEGYRFKPLLMGLRFKRRGSEGEAIREGETVSVRRSEIGEITLVRGAHWWKFRLLGEQVLAEAQAFARAHAPTTGGDESRTERNLAIGVSIALAALMTVLSLLPKNPEVLVEPPEQPVVKFIIQPRSEPAPPPVVVQAPASAPVAPQAPASKAPARKTPPPPVAKAAPAPPAPRPQPVDPRAQAQAASAARLKALREALGGATSLSQKAVPIGKSAAGTALSLDAGSVKVGQTQVRASYTGTTEGAATVGGKTAGVGYDSGDRADVRAGGGGLVSVDGGGAKVQEGLSRDEVGRVIHSHLDEVRACHETALLYQPNLSGRVLVEFSINAQGKVVGARVQSENVGEKTLPGCIVGKLVRWQFPKPKGGVTVKVSYPFNFKTLVRD